MTSFEHDVRTHLNSMSPKLKRMYRSAFERDHMVVLDDLLPMHLVGQITAEATTLVDKEATRRDLLMKSAGNTPRAFLSVGRDAITNYNGVIPQLFHSGAVLDFISYIAGEKLFKVPYVPEEYVISSQVRAGDTHGWHWDDYSYALIWVVEAPDAISGGRIEYVPHSTWDKRNTEECMRSILSNRDAVTRYIPAGSCYLLKSDTSLHRVAPLSGQQRRTVVVYSYATERELTDTSITHESIEAIYPEDALKNAPIA